MAPTRARKDNGPSTKARLIAAASGIMRDEDRITFTLQEVAARSGLNSALVGYHFGNKEGLMFAVLETDVVTGLEDVERLLARSDYGPVKQMWLHIAGTVETYANIPYLHRLIQTMTRDATEERAEWIGKSVISRIAGGQKRILDEGVACGLFREVDPMSFYFTVVGAAGSLYSQRFVMRSAFDVDKVSPEAHDRNVSQIADLLLRGLLVDPNSVIMPPL